MFVWCLCTAAACLENTQNLAEEIAAGVIGDAHERMEGGLPSSFLVLAISSIAFST